MNFPEELYYTKEHEWARLEEDGKTITIGITDFAQGELGDIVFVEFEELDIAYDADSIFGSVEAVKTVSDLFMPIQGTLIAINEALEDAPELVNQDPYGEGWMVKIVAENPDDIQTLLKASEYAAMVGE